MLKTLGELNLALDKREEGVVLTTADVLAGVDVGAVLADENLAGLHGLTVKTLGAQTLAAGVATIAGGTETFFVCHVRYLLSNYLQMVRLLGDGSSGSSTLVVFLAARDVAWTW
mgnify:CR=1 FL=1